MSRSVLFWVLGTLGCGLCAASYRPLPQQIQDDLKLELELKGDPEIYPGSYPGFEVRLVNRSKWSTHPVVRPGDGSQEGRREPHVYFTATVDRGDGRPIPVPPENYGYCGLFKWAWVQDAIELK